MSSDLSSVLLSLFNAPDLILIAFLLINAAFGWYRGLLRSAYGLVGKIVSTVCASIAARLTAPMLASLFITQLEQKIAEQQSALGAVGVLLDGVRVSSMQAAQTLAESASFALLFLVFAILFGWLFSMLIHSLRTVVEHTPLRIVDCVGGAAIGLITGSLLIVLALVGLKIFSPVTYTELGWLSPALVEQTLLLRTVLSLLPFT